jgi:hypothetical protein
MGKAYSNKLNMKTRYIALGVALKIAFLALFLTSCKTAVPGSAQEAVKQLGQQQNEGFEAFFMPIIGRRLKDVGLGELKSELVPEGVKEARIWVGFSHYGFSGLILKIDSTNGSAIYIPDPKLGKTLPPSQGFRLLPAPKSGWQELSTKLQHLDLYDLPGEPDRVPGRKMITDAICAIVEIKTSSSYRAYQYVGIFYYKGEETKKMETIIDTLSSEFGIELY